MKKTLLTLIISVFIIGCTEFEEPRVNTSASEPETRSVLTAEDNPYALRNVQKAMNTVCAELGEPSVLLKPTHLYVRFLPRDSVEYTQLVDSCDLMLFGYPLDRELTDEEVDFYEQDTTNTYGYPWMYTKVPTNYVFPENIAHEVLDEVVVEEFTEDGLQVVSPNIINREVWDRVLTKSMKLPETRAGYKWRPFAKISYVDDLTDQTIPLEGVRVRCHHLLHVEESYTNAKGEATTFGTFKYNARYKIFWEDRNYWDIRDGTVWQAKTKGPKKNGPWELVISGDNETAMFAAIHRGCRAIFYDNVFGVTRPQQGRIKLCAFYTKDAGINGDYSEMFHWIWPSIRIFRINGGYKRARWQMTSTAIHELGHASHHRAVVELPGANRYSDFVGADDKVKDSWARGFEYAFMSRLYPDLPSGRFRPNPHSQYTWIVEWLMNQGLTLKQIERTVVGNRTWSEWRRDVKALKQIDEVIVDMLFNYSYGYYFAADFKNLIAGSSQVFTSMDVTYSLPSEDNLAPQITLTKWTLSGAGYTILADDKTPRSIKLRFSTLGVRTLTAQIKLIDGTSYEVVKKINVTSRGVISGAVNPQIGVATTYSLTNYTGTVDKWEFTGLVARDYLVVNTTANSVSVVFFAPCSPTITAKFQNNELASKELTVQNGAAITSFVAYKDQEWPYDFLFYNSVNGNVPAQISNKGLRTVEPPTSPRHFMAYGGRPSALHPYYSHLKPIYENGYHHDKYAYDIKTYPDFPQYGVKFWIYDFPYPGTVPLYLVVDSKFKEKKIVHKIQYLTREDVTSVKKVTSWYWNWLGTSKTGDKNWTEVRNFGVLGYVYPYSR